MVNESIRKELSRVRDGKRALAAEVKFLRLDMEQGKIHIRVSQDKAFRQKVAEAVVAEAEPGYHSQGYYYADPVEGVVHFKQNQAFWNPWSDDINFLVVGIGELVSQGNDFDPSVDWDIASIPKREMIAAFLEDQGEEFEANGDIPNWVSMSEVIAFAVSHSEEWQKQIEEIESNAREEAIAFALSEILDEIVVEAA